MEGDDKSRRRRPVQARSRATVDVILEGAARVFRREGWNATTNRIAAEAGVSIGSLYEYFPDKGALMHALARRHVEQAEAGVDAALDAPGSSPAELLESIQTALLRSQRFPSHALTLVEATEEGTALRARAEALRSRLLGRLREEAQSAGLDDPELRARVCFEVVAELSSRAMFTDPGDLARLCRHYLQMGLSHLVGAHDVR